MFISMLIFCFLSCLLSLSDVLALPIFKQEKTSLPPDHETKNPPFQYVLCAATSPAVKLHDETLTYLNQGETISVSFIFIEYWSTQKMSIVFCAAQLCFYTPEAFSPSVDVTLSPQIIMPPQSCHLSPFAPILPLFPLGQSYEVRMLDNRKPGELPELNNKMVKVRQPEDTQTENFVLTFDVRPTSQLTCAYVYFF